MYMLHTPATSDHHHAIQANLVPHYEADKIHNSLEGIYLYVIYRGLRSAI